MFRRTKALLVVAAVSAALAPAAQAEDTGGGFGCGFTSTNDPTGQIVNDPSIQTGEIDGGPWAIVNIDGGSISDVTIECRIKINDGANNRTGGTVRSTVTPGNVGVLADTISYAAAVGDDVYLCSYIAWTSTKGLGEFYFDDDDDPSNGNQCSLATSVEA